MRAPAQAPGPGRFERCRHAGQFHAPAAGGPQPEVGTPQRVHALLDRAGAAGRRDAGRASARVAVGAGGGCAVAVHDSGPHRRGDRVGDARGRKRRARTDAGGGPALVWRTRGRRFAAGCGQHLCHRRLSPADERIRAHAGNRTAWHQPDARGPHQPAPAGVGNLPPDGVARPARGQGLGANAAGRRNHAGADHAAPGRSARHRTGVAGHADRAGRTRGARHCGARVPIFSDAGV